MKPFEKLNHEMREFSYNMAQYIVLGKEGAVIHPEYQELAIWFLNVLILHVLMHFKKNLRSSFTLLSYVDSVATVAQVENGKWVCEGVTELDKEFDDMPDEDEVKKEYRMFRDYCGTSDLLDICSLLRAKILAMYRYDSQWDTFHAALHEKIGFFVEEDTE